MTTTTYRTAPISPAFMNLTIVTLGTVDLGTVGFEVKSATYFFNVASPVGSIISGWGHSDFSAAEAALLDASADYPAAAPAKPWTNEELDAAGFGPRAT